MALELFPVLFYDSVNSFLHIFNFYFYFDTVIGCILPTAPKHGRIVSKSENAITFLCDPLFIFSGTNENTRTLYCTKRNIWNKNLPNCVGMLKTRFYSSDEITSILTYTSISLYHLFADNI